MESNRTSSSGLGFVGVLQLAFIILKLCDVIKWSWLWVLSPIWISVGLGVLALIIIVLGTKKI